jgi:N-acetylneuraminic acid mutarotase
MRKMALLLLMLTCSLALTTVLHENIVDGHFGEYTVSGLTANSTYINSEQTTINDSMIIVEDSWTEKTPNPQGGAVYGAGVVNGKIYAFGAYFYNGTVFPTSGEYDPDTDTWIEKAPMPTLRINFATTVYENKIYTIGGQQRPIHNISDAPVNTVEVYDPTTNLWSTKTALPTARAYMQAGVANGKIYVFGGWTSPENPTYGYVNATEIYNPQTDTWSAGAAIPLPIYRYALAALDNKMYLIGGNERVRAIAGGFDYPTVNRMLIYDPATNTWAMGASLPVAVIAVAGATTGITAPAAIYVFGENTDRGSHTFTQIYNPKSNSWLNGTESPEFNTAPALAVLNDAFFLMGGSYSEFTPSSTPWEPPESNPPPPFYSSNYQYSPFGYETFNVIPTPTPSSTPPTKPLGSDLSSLLLLAVAIVVACVFIAGLIIVRKKLR